MSSKPAADGRVWAIAHRGASKDRPENTIAAFDEARRQGCDGIELDLQLTRDGAVIVYHDRTASKLGRGRRRIGSMDLDEVLALDAGAWFDPAFTGERVPTLSRVLERLDGPTRLLLELKAHRGPDEHRRLLRAVVGEIRRAGAAERVFLLCFDPQVLESAARLAPDLQRVLNVARIGTVATLSRRPPGLAALSLDVRALTGPVIRALRRDGSPLFVFTCNLPADVERALDAGAVAVMSDRPAWLAGILRDRVASQA